jgi:universal stress protein E
MNKWKNIVVGVDFTENSQKALEEAYRLAEHDGAAVHAVHVIESLAVSELQQVLRKSLDDLKEEVSEDTRRRLEELFKDVKPGGYDILEPDGTVTSTSGGTLTASAEVMFGNPTEELLKRVEELKAELLVLARNSTSKPERGAGTYAVRCVRKAPTNVLLTHNKGHGSFRHIVACVDFSEFANEGLREAAALAKHDGAKLELLHAFYPPWEVVHFTAFPVDASPNFQNEYQQLLETRIKRIAETVQDEYRELRVTSTLLPSATHASGIVDYLTESKADLAVIGSRGQTGIKRFLLGSTAERVVREAPCSVLVVKASSE